MSTRARRWTLMFLSALIASAIGAWILERRNPRESASTIVFREAHESADTAEVPFIPREEFFAFDAEAPIAEKPEARRFFMSRKTIESIWGPDNQWTVYDPWTWGWDPGSRDEEYPWPEHPKGSWNLTTNRDGLRESGDPLSKRCDVRVLATGDSHSFGVCDTDETYASQLEKKLAPTLAPRSVEVLNAAQPGFDAFNYLGVLHRFLKFEPQVFVVLFFGGNDLLSPLDTYYRFTREPVPTPPANEKRRRAEVIGHAPHAFGQCYEGAPMLLLHPEQGALAAKVNARLFAEMQNICMRRGVRFIVLYLPSPCDLPWNPAPEEIEIGRKRSGLPEGVGSGLAEVEQQFLAALAALSIEVVDMRPAFQASAEPAYWRGDLHLSLTGHGLVADALAPLIQGIR